MKFSNILKQHNSMNSLCVLTICC